MTQQERRSFTELHPFVRFWRVANRPQGDEPALPVPSLLPHLLSSFGFASRVASATVILVGALVSFAQQVPRPELTRFFPGLKLVEFPAAVSFVLTGLALLLLQKGSADRIARGIAQLGAGVVVLFSSLTVTEKLFGWDSGFVYLLFRPEGTASVAHAQGGLPLASAVNFVLVGCALILLDVEIRHGHRPAQYLVLLATLISLLSILDATLGRSTSFTDMSVPTSLGFLVLSAGVLLARPDRGLMVVFARDTFGGTLARRLLPAAILVSLVLAWLRFEGERAGLYSTHVGVSLIATANMAILVILIWWTARSLDRADLERRQTQLSLRKAYGEMESRVVERTASLLKANEALQIEAAERRRAEEALRERETRFRALIENSADAIALIDANAKILYASPSMHRVLGYSAEEFVGRNVFEFMHPDDLERTQALFSELIEEPGARVATQYRYLHKDGSWRWMEAAGANLLAEPGVRAVVANYRDITERRHAEEALRESEARYRVVAETATDAFVTMNASSRILFVNAAAERIFGHTREEMLGQELTMLMPEYLRELHRVGVKRYLQTGEKHMNWESVELTALHKSGREIPVEVSFGEYVIAGERGFTGIVRDISERKQAQQALQQANDMLTGWLKELEKRTHETSLLYEMGGLLQTCVSAEEAYSVIARIAQQLFPSETGAVCVLHPSQNVVEAVAVWGDSPPGESVFSPEECWALRRGQVHVVADPASGPLCKHLNPQPRGGYMCVPMMGQGEALGVLHLQGGSNGASGGDRLKEGKQRLAITVAGHIALALANLRLRETLRIQSTRDPLTGLFNRRYMEESLARELRRAARGQQNLGAIMLDLDHFKRFNDTYGHEAGDLLLRELGNFLRMRTRKEDIACRYGGEEFALILPDASTEVTRQRAERLREEFKRIDILYQGQTLGAVTLSLGVAVFPEHALTAEEILRSADRALYRAKAEGRDRVALAEPVD